MDLSTQQKEPLVSVIISVLNDAVHIEETILSVLSQEYANKELVIIDGGSTDGTVELIQKYEDKISFFVSEPDKGIYNGFNKGIQHCHGEWIKILNSGDFFFHNHCIEQAIEVCNKHTNTALFIYSPIMVVSEEGEYLKRDTHKFFRCSFKLFPSVFHPSWFLHRSVYLKLGEYNENYKISSDYEYYLKILKAKIEGIFCDDLTFVCFRTGGASSGFSGVLETFVINKEHKGFLKAAYVLFIHYVFKLACKFKIIFKNTLRKESMEA